MLNFLKFDLSKVESNQKRNYNLKQKMTTYLIERSNQFMVINQKYKS